MDPEEYQIELDTMATNITKDMRTKISKYVVVVDPKHGDEWIECLKKVVSDCLSMEPRKKIGLDKVHLIAITRFQNHVRNDLLRAFFTGSDTVLKKEFCYPVDEKFGHHTLAKWLKKMIFWDQVSLRGCLAVKALSQILLNEGLFKGIFPTL